MKSNNIAKNILISLHQESVHHRNPGRLRPRRSRQLQVRGGDGRQGIRRPLVRHPVGRIHVGPAEETCQVEDFCWGQIREEGRQVRGAQDGRIVSLPEVRKVGQFQMASKLLTDGITKRLNLGKYASR